MSKHFYLYCFLKNKTKRKIINIIFAIKNKKKILYNYAFAIKTKSIIILYIFYHLKRSLFS